MPLNKLENFIKNTEGRILYVNPSDLDSTDAIENQGNSLYFWYSWKLLLGKSRADALYVVYE